MQEGQQWIREEIDHKVATMEESETIASAPPPPPDPGETQNLPPMSYHHNVENNDFQQLNRALFQLQPHAILSQTLPTRYGHYFDMSS